MRPMSPMAAAPSRASIRACVTASASECPARPCGWGISTPPRMSLRPAVNLWESYPMPTRIGSGPLQDADGEVRGVLGIVHADGRHRHTRRHLHRGEERVEAVQGAYGEPHADHRQI